MNKEQTNQTTGDLRLSAAELTEEELLEVTGGDQVSGALTATGGLIAFVGGLATGNGYAIAGGATAIANGVYQIANSSPPDNSPPAPYGVGGYDGPAPPDNGDSLGSGADYYSGS